MALIPAWLNIPVLSFLWLRGRSRCCGVRLSWQYPVVELLTGVLFAFIYSRFPFWEFSTFHFSIPNLLRFSWCHFVLRTAGVFGD
jgi:prepilin signal peptidase PulO-like enzyme (type II secretory pathway)